MTAKAEAHNDPQAEDKEKDEVPEETIELIIEGCVWQTICNRKSDVVVKIKHDSRGTHDETVEIEVDGTNEQDNLQRNNTTQVEGKKIRVHLTGDNSNEARIEAKIRG